MFVKRFLAVFYLLLMASCAPQPPPTLTTTAPPLVQVGVDPTLDWLRPDAQSCSREISDRLWDIQTAHPEPDGGILAGLILQWGGSDEESPLAYVLGEDNLRIVVHPDNPLSRLSVKLLALIFAGEIQTWDAVDPALPPEEIQLLAYAQASHVQTFFDRTILDNQDELSSLAQLAPDPAAMRSAVAQNTTAIGILPARWLDDSVKPLALDGVPGELSQPILAIVAQPPDEAVSAWLICLQERLRP